MQCYTAICYKFAPNYKKLTRIQIRVDKVLSQVLTLYLCSLRQLVNQFINYKTKEK